jgi:hypothetical protein
VVAPFGAGTTWIDQNLLLMRFDASHKRYGPSERVAATDFIEDYIVSNGRLP